MKKISGNRWQRMAVVLITSIITFFLVLPQAGAFTRPSKPNNPGKPDIPDKPDRPGNPEIELIVTSDKTLYLTPDKAKIQVQITGEGKVDLYYKFEIPETDESMQFVKAINNIYIPMAEDWEIQETTLEYNIPLIALWPDGDYVFSIVATRPKVNPRVNTLANASVTFEVKDRRNNTFIQPGSDGIEFSVANIFSIDTQIDNGQLSGVVLFQKPNGEEVWSKSFTGTYEYSLREKKIIITLMGEDGYHGGVITLTIDNKILYLTAETEMGRSAQLSYNFAEDTFAYNFERAFNLEDFRNASSFSLHRNGKDIEVVFEYQRPNGRVITKGFSAYFDHEEDSTNFRIESIADSSKFIQINVETGENSLTVEFEDGKGHKVGKTVEYYGSLTDSLNFDELYGKGVSLH